MRKYKWLLILIIGAVIFGTIIFLLFPRVKLSNKEVNYGMEYKPNVSIYNIVSNLSKYSKVTNNVDTNRLGNYNVNVKFKYLFISFNRNYDVEVVDKVEPVINIEGSEIGIACPGKEYVEEGYIASDDYDGDITDKVKVEIGDNKIIYSVSDSSENNYKTERFIEYKDETVPVITLNGNDTIYVYIGNSYKELGYVALDNCDGDITDKVEVIGGVDTSKVGTYKITYTVTDNSGNSSSVERTVIVRKKNVYNTYGDGIVYLTFDDGPSERTREILNILDDEGIKATFFVCGANEYTKRAYNSGHTIALHSNTHEYSYIYASGSNFFNDLATIENKVYNVIGIRPKIIRFPGGSSNTISRHYSYGIMSYLTNEVENRGYTYFDWNVDSNDAGSDVYNSDNIYANVINHLSHSKTNIVLMHDSGGHTATVAALRNIIKTAKGYGYSFKAIDESTPVVHHGVNN